MQSNVLFADVRGRCSLCLIGLHLFFDALSDLIKLTSQCIHFSPQLRSNIVQCLEHLMDLVFVVIGHFAVLFGFAFDGLLPFQDPLALPICSAVAQGRDLFERGDISHELFMLLLECLR